MTAFIVHKATGWLPDGRRITCEDWPSQELAIEALDKSREWIWAYYDVDALADVIMAELNVDPARPYGCSILVEE